MNGDAILGEITAEMLGEAIARKLTMDRAKVDFDPIHSLNAPVRAVAKAAVGNKLNVVPLLV